MFSHSGDTHQLRLKVYDRDGLPMAAPAPAAWSSSDDSVLVVDAAGLVTAKRSGGAIVRVALGALAAELPLGVEIVGAVEIVPAKDVTLKLGRALTLRARVKDDRGEEMPHARVEWHADSHAVEVADGAVTAQAQGQATVSASSGDKGASVHVTVR